MSEESTNNAGSGGNKRPVFLTILCILSFIGIGFALIGGIISVVTYSAMDTELMADSMDEMSDLMEESGEGGGLMDMLFSNAEAQMKHGRTLGLIGIVSAILCLIGVLRMWKMKKSGYFMYIVGELAPPIAGIVLVGGLAATGLFFPVVFVILYGLNVKHMS